jgi:tetraacyldisaccharide-1-P 4'-kinase
MSSSNAKQYLLKNKSAFDILFLDDKNQKQHFKHNTEMQVSQEVYNRLIVDKFVEDLTKSVIEKAKKLKDSNEQKA